MQRNNKTLFYSLTFHSMLVLNFTLLGSLSPVTSVTHPDDIQAMKDLKNSIDIKSIPNGSCLTSWDFSFDPCDRIFSDRFTCGFRCDRFVSGLNRVTQITLDPVGYSGSLSFSSWNLSYLQTLDLSDNSFSGPIPDSLSDLTRLRRLGLSKNSFSGSIPESFGNLSNLEELYLDNNRLNGVLPPSFNRLSSLKRLEIQSNRISGGIPILSSLRKLYFLDLSENRIAGEIPATLPPSLVEISVRSNWLTGNLPEILKELGFLQVLDVSHNRLSGSLPASLFNHASLQQLTLSHNNFTSLQNPGATARSSKLIAVDLSFNRIRELLPVFMAQMPRLSALTLEHNTFTGMIPSEYAVRAAAAAEEEGGDGVTASFQRLLLGGNYLVGIIPGPLLGLKPGSADVNLADNCLYSCPSSMFFCKGRDQKSLVECKRFWPSLA